MRMKTAGFFVFFLLAASLCSQSVYADKLCVKIAVNKKTHKVKTTRAVAAACPSGFTELIDTSTFVGPQGPAGTNGTNGADGAVAVYGNGGDGSLTVSSSTTFTNGNAQYTDVTINAGVTLQVYSGTVIRCTGTFTNNGTISVMTEANAGAVYYANPANVVSVVPAGRGESLTPASVGEKSSTVSAAVVGGAGGVGFQYSFSPALLGHTIHGGGGGAGSLDTNGFGGNGGGFFAVYAQGAITNGSGAFITADGSGASSSGGGGGGAGGIVILASKASVTNSGTIRARGAAGGASTTTTAAGGGGGGGLIHILAPSVTVGTRSVAPGPSGTTATAVTSAHHSGGGGGGACYGNGGSGGAVAGLGPNAGASGAVLSSTVDPTSSLL